MIRLSPLLLFILLASIQAACGRPAGPEEVARAFLDKYYVEVNQDGALPLTAGLAEEKIKEELNLVKGIRGSGVRAEEARASVYYKLRETRGATQKRAIYLFDLTIKGPKKEGIKKGVVIYLTRLEEGWRVTNFQDYDLPR